MYKEQQEAEVMLSSPPALFSFSPGCQVRQQSSCTWSMLLVAIKGVVSNGTWKNITTRVAGKKSKDLFENDLKLFLTYSASLALR